MLLLVANAQLASPVLPPGIDATALGVVGAADGYHVVGPAGHTFEEAELRHLAELLNEALPPSPAQPELATLQGSSDEQLPKRRDHHGVVWATVNAFDRLVFQARDQIRLFDRISDEAQPELAGIIASPAINLLVSGHGEDMLTTTCNLLHFVLRIRGEKVHWLVHIVCVVLDLILFLVVATLRPSKLAESVGSERVHLAAVSQ